MQLSRKATPLPCVAGRPKGLRSRRDFSSNFLVKRVQPLIVPSAAAHNAAYGSWDFPDDESRATPQHSATSPKSGYGSGDFDEVTSKGSDKGLLATAAELLLHLRRFHVGKNAPHSHHNMAAAALAAAEADGAVPPLSGVQRQAFQDALAAVSASGVPIAFESLSETEDPSHVYELVEEGLEGFMMNQEFRGLLQELSTLELREGWGEGGRTYDPVAFGGEQGNISIPRSHAPARDVAAPAEGRTERTEHEAEGDYMAMEINTFEAHAPRDVGGTVETERGTMTGDAPAAGDGMQTAGNGVKGDGNKARPPAADF